MFEISYEGALNAGIEPIQYRTDALPSLGEGEFPGILDALVWTKRKPALMALLTLDAGPLVSILGFNNSLTSGHPYAGLRRLEPSRRVVLTVSRGIRGGWRPLVQSADEADHNRPAFDGTAPVEQILQTHNGLSRETVLAFVQERGVVNVSDVGERFNLRRYDAYGCLESLRGAQYLQWCRDGRPRSWTLPSN